MVANFDLILGNSEEMVNKFFGGTLWASFYGLPEAEYQGEHGLKETFFSDTVKNALAWWESNKERIKKELPPNGSSLANPRHTKKPFKSWKAH